MSWVWVFVAVCRLAEHLKDFMFHSVWVGLLLCIPSAVHTRQWEDVGTESIPMTFEIISKEGGSTLVVAVGSGRGQGCGNLTTT